MSEKPVLILLPNVLGEQRHHQPFIPPSVDKVVPTLNGIIAESEKEGRRYLTRFLDAKQAASIPIALLNEHTPDKDLDFLLDPIVKGERWGLVSDAGLPCVADPGSKLVRRARQRGIAIQAFVGPSSIMMALMLSGISGQRFTFHGYLPREENERKKHIQELVVQSRKERVTQIFMEAPYKNKHVLDDLIALLPDSAWLCVAWDLTMPTQGVVSQQVAQWKKMTIPNIDKKPAIFIFSDESVW